MKESLSHLKTPEAWLSELWNRIPSYIRLTFASSVILGLATHLYVFTNKFTNHDDLDQMFFASYGTPSGRWLLPFALRLDGEFSMPWLIGILSILCLAGVACFTVSILRIRRPFGCVAASAIVTAFPTVASTFAYMFTAYAYFLALLLAAFGAYAAVRWGWPGSALGTVAITLSLGIYQSYFPVAAVLMVGALLLETLDGNRSFKELLLRGLRFVATLIAPMAAYLVVVRFTTMDIGLTDYHGISDMGQISLKDLPTLVYKGYEKCLSFFLKNDLGWHFSFLKYGFAAIVLCCVVLGVLLLRKRRLDPARIALAVVLVAVYPLAASLIYVMVPSGYVHGVMIYGFAYLLLLPIALADYAEDHLKTGPGAPPSGGRRLDHPPNGVRCRLFLRGDRQQRLSEGRSGDAPVRGLLQPPRRTGGVLRGLPPWDGSGAAGQHCGGSVALPHAGAGRRFGDGHPGSPRSANLLDL